MPEKTEKNLAYAFAGESKASVRNEAFARKADLEGYSQLARLFRAVSEAESVHARRYLLLMRGKIDRGKSRNRFSERDQGQCGRISQPD